MFITIRKIVNTFIKINLYYFIRTKHEYRPFKIFYILSGSKIGIIFPPV